MVEGSLEWMMDMLRKDCERVIAEHRSMHDAVLVATRRALRATRANLIAIDIRAVIETLSEAIDYCDDEILRRVNR